MGFAAIDDLDLEAVSSDQLCGRLAREKEALRSCLARVQPGSVCPGLRMIAVQAMLMMDRQLSMRSCCCFFKAVWIFDAVAGSRASAAPWRSPREVEAPERAALRCASAAVLASAKLELVESERESVDLYGQLLEVANDRLALLQQEPLTREGLLREEVAILLCRPFVLDHFTVDTWMAALEHRFHLATHRAYVETCAAAGSLAESWLLARALAGPVSAEWPPFEQAVGLFGLLLVAAAVIAPQDLCDAADGREEWLADVEAVASSQGWREITGQEVVGSAVAAATSSGHKKSAVVFAAMVPLDVVGELTRRILRAVSAAPLRRRCEFADDE